MSFLKHCFRFLKLYNLGICRCGFSAADDGHPGGRGGWICEGGGYRSRALHDRDHALICAEQRQFDCAVEYPDRAISVLREALAATRRRSRRCSRTTASSRHRIGSLPAPPVPGCREAPGSPRTPGGGQGSRSSYFPNQRVNNARRSSLSASGGFGSAPASFWRRSAALPRLR